MNNTINNNEWDSLMCAAQQGDKSAYRHLLTALQPWLRRYFNNRIPPSYCDDLVQEVMMTLHQKMQTYDPQQPFLPWIKTIAKHRWIDMLRKIYRRMETTLDDETDLLFQTSDKTESYDIIKLLAKIPVAQAEVIDLVKLREMSIAQAAQQTGHSQASVKVMIHRGLKRLSSLVQEGTKEGKRE
jgi:RNA polymerase sigma-70 factor (ECF subfamily)